MADAQVSGPGAYSQRTDTGGQPIRSLPDPAYGEATAFRDAQKAAPLADSASGGPKGPYPSDIARTAGANPEPIGQAPPQEALPGLFDPTQRPDEPVTHGAPLGAGANAIAGLPGMPGEFNPAHLRDSLAPYFAADTTGMIATLANSLAERGWL